VVIVDLEFLAIQVLAEFQVIADIAEFQVTLAFQAFLDTSEHQDIVVLVA